MTSCSPDSFFAPLARHKLSAPVSRESNNTNLIPPATCFLLNWKVVSCLILLYVEKTLYSKQSCRFPYKFSIMDNEFELVDQRRGKHEIVAAEDLEEQDDFSQSNNPQRRPVVLPISVVALVLIALATIVTKAYLSPGELAGNFHQYENGERGENGTISDDSLSDPVDHFRNHSQNINYPDDIRNWLLANVTLGDRKMYKVVAKLDHDTQAFT